MPATSPTPTPAPAGEAGIPVEEGTFRQLERGGMLLDPNFVATALRQAAEIGMFPFLARASWTAFYNAHRLFYFFMPFILLGFLMQAREEYQAISADRKERVELLEQGSQNGVNYKTHQLTSESPASAIRYSILDSRIQHNTQQFIVFTLPSTMGIGAGAIGTLVVGAAFVFGPWLFIGAMSLMILKNIRNIKHNWSRIKELQRLDPDKTNTQIQDEIKGLRQEILKDVINSILLFSTILLVIGAFLTPFAALTQFGLGISVALTTMQMLGWGIGKKCVDGETGLTYTQKKKKGYAENLGRLFPSLLDISKSSYNKGGRAETQGASDSVQTDPSSSEQAKAFSQNFT